MKLVQKLASSLLIAALAVLPVQLSTPSAAQATVSTETVQAVQTLQAPQTGETVPAQTDTPFTIQSVLGAQGRVQAVFTYTGTLEKGQQVELAVSKRGSKQSVYEGKLKATAKTLKLDGLAPGDLYSFNVKITGKKKDTLPATESYTGDLVVQVKQDAKGNVTNSNLQLSRVEAHSSLNLADGQVQSLLSVYETESNNTFGTANRVITGDDMFGKIDSSTDVDFYKVQFYNNGIGRFWLGGIPTGCDYDLYVYDQNFNQIDYSMWGSNYDEVITDLPVTANQWYYVKVVGYNSTYNTSNSYDLQVTGSTTPALNSDSYENNNTFDTAVAVGKSDTIYANLPSAADVDYYRIYVPLRSTFALNLSNLPTGTDYDVVLYDASQNWVDSSMNWGTAPESISDTLNPGYYYIKVTPYSGSSTSNYKLDLSTNTIPVILFPGIGGTELNNNGSLTWFGLWDALLINEPIKHNLSLNPACSGCTDVVAKYSDVSISPVSSNYGLDGISYVSSIHLSMTSYYNDMINDLVKAGYVPGKTLFGFPYDWRLDNHCQNTALTNKINEALNASGATKVQAVAHSMGGLVVKDYLLNQTGMAGKFDQVTTLGTPYLGAALASKALALGGYNFGVPILMNSTGEAIAQNAPAVYQLAPSNEYNNQVNAKLGRSTYQYIDILGHATNYTHAQLNAKYPNQALAAQADQRHSQWDTSYPGVTQYHIVGDTVDTITAYNYWEMKDIFHWFYLEYVMTKGDGTVPSFSAMKPGSSGASFYFSGADHMGLVKDAATRAQVLNIVKGTPNTVASGIRTSASTGAMTMLTANSLTAAPTSFNNMTVELTNLKDNSTSVIKFRSDGTIDDENSTAGLMAQVARLEDGTNNLQFFINKYDNYSIVVKSTDGTEFIVAKYDLNDSGASNRFSYGKLQNFASAPLTIRQINGNTMIYQGNTLISGQQLTIK
ncbi:lipase/acyltransferase domain-containing protein [Tumebacillus flagellatus]|uniref:Lecithin:cholesterol acyltransferase n=1 Tax=Tumebacillus flagellatus TaxID=1157490 RepID=A0A074LNF4_9BACL|nr:hypothetical protein [Tumebacillus flagellatus]KEO83651.1 hypothetical protein EL26_08305 [Tumebacillus flagellatus]